MPSTSLRDCDEQLRTAFIELREAYQHQYPGHALGITATFRSTQEQQELYAKGRTRPGQIVTQLDGVTHLSKHNVYPARALDFCVIINGKVSWDEAEYEPVAKLAESLGLIAGGHWPHFKDWPHLELPDKEVPP